jgi:hypothetical protein
MVSTVFLVERKSTGCLFGYFRATRTNQELTTNLIKMPSDVCFWPKADIGNATELLLGSTALTVDLHQFSAARPIENHWV